MRCLHLNSVLLLHLCSQLILFLVQFFLRSFFLTFLFNLLSYTFGRRSNALPFRYNTKIPFFVLKSNFFSKKMQFFFAEYQHFIKYFSKSCFSVRKGVIFWKDFACNQLKCSISIFYKENSNEKSKKKFIFL